MILISDRTQCTRGPINYIFDIFLKSLETTLLHLAVLSNSTSVLIFSNQPIRTYLRLQYKNYITSIFTIEHYLYIQKRITCNIKFRVKKLCGSKINSVSFLFSENGITICIQFTAPAFPAGRDPLLAISIQRV